MIRCTCCNTELTAPQFYNGHPYGMTCIKRIDPAQKVVKTVYVATESFKITSGEGTSRMVIRTSYKGKTKAITVYVGTNGQWSNALLQDGVLYVAESLFK